MEALTSLPSVAFAVKFSSGTARLTNKVQATKCQDLVCRLRLSGGKVASFKTSLPRSLRFSAQYAGSSTTTSTSPRASLLWVLEPAGDGDSSHLEEKVAAVGPIALKLDSSVLGRLDDKADIVIPVATVSGCHARLEKKGSKLYVTDLDSTNGTFIGDRRLRPGSVTEVSPGSFLTFGDEHLAQFRFTLVEESAKVSEE